MNFIVRSASGGDEKQLEELARQFTLLNLPADRSTIRKKIDKSKASFAGDLPPAEAEYLFVLEEVSDGFIAGSSQVVGKKGTQDKPAYSFLLSKEERYSKDLSIGMIHQVLKMKVETDGAAELGGLVMDRAYRRHPEKLGKLISLIRFLYIGMEKEKFGSILHAEMAPPLTEDGRSEFWEALGRRFTGMPYAEADALSQRNKNFIQDLFPQENIYLALLDPKARLVVGQIADETQAAMHLLKKMGFEDTDEIDPFDGGPHLKCQTSEVPIIANKQNFECSGKKQTSYDQIGFVGSIESGKFRGGQSPYRVNDGKIDIPELTMQALEVSPGQTVTVSPLP